MITSSDIMLVVRQPRLHQIVKLQKIKKPNHLRFGCHGLLQQSQMLITLLENIIFQIELKNHMFLKFLTPQEIQYFKKSDPTMVFFTHMVIKQQETCQSHKPRL